MKRKLELFKTDRKEDGKEVINEKMADEIESRLNKLREYHNTQEYKDKIKKEEDEERAVKKKVTDYVYDKFKDNEYVHVDDWNEWDFQGGGNEENIMMRLTRKKVPDIHLYVLMKIHKGDEVWFHHFTGPMFAI